MINKKWGTIICVIFAFMLSGCSLPGSQPAVKVTSPDSEVMEGFDKNLVVREGDETGSDAKADDFSTEVRHWKYGDQTSSPNAPAAPAQPSYPAMADAGTEDGRVISMQFLTAQELDRIQDILVEQGYLKTPTRDEKIFNEAVAKFQQSHELSPTGELDGRTIACFNQNSLQKNDKTQ